MKKLRFRRKIDLFSFLTAYFPLPSIFRIFQKLRFFDKNSTQGVFIVAEHDSDAENIDFRWFRPVFRLVIFHRSNRVSSEKVDFFAWDNDPAMRIYYRIAGY